MATAAKKTAKKAPATKKPATKKAPAKKTAPAKTATKKTVNKPAAKKTVKKAAPAKKAAPKKAATKTTATKTTAKKPAVKKPAAKKTAPKKTATKKTEPASTAKSASGKKQTPKSTSQKPTPKKSKDPKVTTAAATKKKKEEKPKIAQARRPSRKIPTRRLNEDVNFKEKEQVVYPSHGVGVVISLEKQKILAEEIEFYVVDFEHEKMRLRVPTNRAGERGMRPLSTPDEVDKILTVLEGKARIKRTMWSRRAQEYEQKINSGDLRMVAEVVRDLYRSDEQPEQSYSERQLFEQAIDRMAREVAAVRKCDQDAAVAEMHTHLAKKSSGIAAPEKTGETA